MKFSLEQNTDAASRHSYYEIAYIKLRTGMTLLAVTFPCIFLASSLLLRWTQFQPSISDYYYTEDLERNLFVSLLMSIGILLILYEGYSFLEDKVLTLAGLLAWGIALVPAGTHAWTIGGKDVTPHGIIAVSFFICIYFVAFVFSRTTLSDLDAARRAAFKRYYALISHIMVGSIVLALLAHVLPEEWLKGLLWGHLVFWVEAIGVWCFAAFWYLKTREINPGVSWMPFTHSRPHER